MSVRKKTVYIFWVRSLLCGQIISGIPNALLHRAWECETSHWALRWVKTESRRVFLDREREQTGLQQFSDSGIVYPDLCLRWQKKREVTRDM